MAEYHNIVYTYKESYASVTLFASVSTWGSLGSERHRFHQSTQGSMLTSVYPPICCDIQHPAIQNCLSFVDLKEEDIQYKHGHRTIHIFMSTTRYSHVVLAWCYSCPLGFKVHLQYVKLLNVLFRGASTNEIILIVYSNYESLKSSETVWN